MYFKLNEGPYISKTKHKPVMDERSKQNMSRSAYLIMKAQHEKKYPEKILKMFIESENTGKIYDSHVGGEAEEKVKI